MNILDILLKIAPTALAYGGYKMKADAAREAEREQNAILAAMQSRNTGATDEMVNRTQRQVEQYLPERRMPALEKAERRAITRLREDATAPSPVGDGPVYSGRTSGAYDAAKARSTADELRYATRLAQIMGRAVAPGDLALQEGFSNTQGALDRSRMQSDLQGDLGIDQLRLNEAEPSAGRMFAGDLMQGASVMLGRDREQFPVPGSRVYPGNVVAAGRKLDPRIYGRQAPDFANMPALTGAAANLSRGRF